MTARAGQAAVLFDLDGTLTDPFVGITSSIQFALGQLGATVPAAETLRRYIGPPLRETFNELLGDPKFADEALRLYRERYADTGKFENIMIPDMREAVSAIRDTGAFLSVATSKLETYSIEIVDHFGLSPLFDAVHGSQLDGSRADKSDLIRFIVRHEKLDPSRTVMIGDRLHDVVGALASDIPTIGVMWGFGDRAELEQAGAARIATTPSDLPGLVTDMLATS